MISQTIPGYVRKQSSCCPCMCLCSVFSTVSPLGRYLPKALSFPRSLRLWGRCACAELLDNDRIDSDSVLHSCPIDGKGDIFSEMSTFSQRCSVVDHGDEMSQAVGACCFFVSVNVQTSNGSCQMGKYPDLAVRHSQAFPACLGL